MHFCLLTTFYPPFNFGGDGIDVQRLARALARRGHGVTVVHDIDAYRWLAGHEPPGHPAKMDDGVEVVGLQSALGGLSPLLTHQVGRPVVHGREIRALLDRGRFDVVVFNNISLLGGPGLLRYGGDALRVYIAHEHWLVCPTHVLWRFNREPCDGRACTRCVLAYHRPPQWWRYARVLERRLSEVDLFIARSEFSRSKHEQFGFPKPMRVLPNFVPGALPASREPVSSRRPHERPYFLFVGRLTKIKGAASLMPAFRRYPDADLLIAGTGEEAESLRHQAEGAGNIHFLGRIPNEQLDAYYEHAIAALVPSLGYETFGLVLIEAFRHGTPVVARRIGPFSEVVEQAGGGILFSNEPELLAAVRELQADPAKRAALGERAYQACRARWSEPAVVDRFLGWIEDARVRPRRRAP